MAKYNAKDDDNDDVADFDEIDGEDEFDGEFEERQTGPLIASRRLAARRAIELAREELSLRRELEDFPDYF